MAEPDDTGAGQYVTRAELDEVLDTKLDGLVDKLKGLVAGGDDGWVDVDDDDDATGGGLKLADVEAAAYNATRKALAELGIKRTQRKGPAPKPPVAPTPKPEDPPTNEGRLSWKDRLWRSVDAGGR